MGRRPSPVLLPRSSLTLGFSVSLFLPAPQGLPVPSCLPSRALGLASPLCSHRLRRRGWRSNRGRLCRIRRSLQNRQNNAVKLIPLQSEKRRQTPGRSLEEIYCTRGPLTLDKTPVEFHATGPSEGAFPRPCRTSRLGRFRRVPARRLSTRRECHREGKRHNQKPIHCVHFFITVSRYLSKPAIVAERMTR